MVENNKSLEKSKPICSADESSSLHTNAEESSTRRSRLLRLCTSDIFGMALSVIAATAFASLYPQINGLYGPDGLTPFEAHLSKMSSVVDVYMRQGGAVASSFWSVESLLGHIPSLLWFSPRLGIPPDVLAEAMCVAGIVTSLLSCCIGGCGFLLATSWMLYLSIYQADQIFLSFQWDLLLLETLFLASIYLPWRTPTWFYRAIHATLSWNFRDSNFNFNPVRCGTYWQPARWMFKFELFKLMLMSGVVKLQSSCPTWRELTALDYHYATQCIPTPLAWYATQLPNWMQQFSVASMFIIELPATLLLVIPLPAAQTFGASLQILLQLLIIFTGNYNFFNLLTITLCLPCLESTLFTDSSTSVEAQGVIGQLQSCAKHFSKHLKLQYAFITLFLSIAAAGMFTFEPNSISVSFRSMFSTQLLNDMLDRYLPVFVMCFSLCFLLSSLNNLRRISDNLPSSCLSKFRVIIQRSGMFILVTAILVIYYTASVGHLYTLRQPTLLRNASPLIKQNLQTSFNWHITSGYGLFRRMTGVMHPPTDTAAQRAMEDMARSHWRQLQAYLEADMVATNSSGLKLPQIDRTTTQNLWRDGSGAGISNVARPEIIIETRNSSSMWSELQFLYKPGDIERSPPWIVPHQPRLDWQMWFAALGSYQDSPWIIHLVYKILQESPAVLGLLGYAPPLHQISSKTKVRATLYVYDFTRYVKSGQYAVPSNLVLNERVRSIDSSRLVESTRYQLGPADRRWWARTKVGEYLPPVDVHEPSLKKALTGLGWRDVSEKMRRQWTQNRLKCSFPEWINTSLHLEAAWKNQTSQNCVSSAVYLQDIILETWKQLMHAISIMFPRGLDLSFGMGLTIPKFVNTHKSHHTTALWKGIHMWLAWIVAPLRMLGSLYIPGITQCSMRVGIITIMSAMIIFSIGIIILLLRTKQIITNQ